MELSEILKKKGCEGVSEILLKNSKEIQTGEVSEIIHFWKRT